MSFSMIPATTIGAVTKDSKNLEQLYQSISPLTDLNAVHYKLNDTEGRWIFCNSQERIYDGANGSLADNGKYFNRVKVEAGTHQLFYSYQNFTGNANVKFDIQIHNHGSTTAKFTPKNYGHYESGTSWFSAALEPWKNFIKAIANTGELTHLQADPGGCKNIAAGGNVWVKEISATKNPFSGILRFEVDKPVTVTVYAYKSNSTIATAKEPYRTGTYDASEREWSGYGEGWFYTAAPIAINANTLSDTKYLNISKRGTSYLPNVTDKTGKKIKTDIIPIHGVHTTSSTSFPNGITKDPTLSGDNLANYCVQYQLAFDFTNTSTTASKKIGFFVRPASADSKHNYPIFNYGGTVYGARLGPASKKDTSGAFIEETPFEYFKTSYNTWKFAEVTVPANTTTPIRHIFQHIVGTNSAPGNDGNIIYYKVI